MKKIPPVFIVGMPRSGTKLLRDLLDNHPQIKILTIETEFLPYWDRNWSGWGGPNLLSKYNNFVRFYNKTVTLTYFIYKSNQGQLIKPEDWFNRCQDFSISGVFEALVRHDTGAAENMIWGDKSPGYIHHIPLIKKHFPEAKIIHIVRDVRDYCLSIHKAWGKNMLRAAQKWSEGVATARKDGAKYKSDYIEIRYEDLIEEPDKQLKYICSFLGVEFDPVMLQLRKPSENIGAAKGMRTIFSKNTKKYVDNMQPHLRRRIERIAFPELSRTGYPSENFSKRKRLSFMERITYQIMDGFNLVRARKKRSGRGTLESINFYMKAFLQSKVK